MSLRRFNFISNKKFQIVMLSIVVLGGTMFFSFKGDENMSDKKENLTDMKTESIEEVENEDLLDEETASVYAMVRENENDFVVLCNKEVNLGAEYIPDDLVVPNVPLVYARDAQQSHLREEAALKLEEMFKDAKTKGLEDLFLVSGYRSYSYQESIFNNSLNTRGRDHTEKYMAKPGHSEHQTGLTADISTQSQGFTLEENFEDTKEGQWLAQNAHKYGFILRYPKDRVETTGYAYEPWHFRYVGEGISTYMFDNKLVLEDIYDSVATNSDSVG